MRLAIVSVVVSTLALCASVVLTFYAIPAKKQCLAAGWLWSNSRFTCTELAKP